MFQKAARHPVFILLTALVLFTQSPTIQGATVPSAVALTLPSDWHPDEVSVDEKSALSKMISFLKKDLSATVTITGHTDNLGMEEENYAIGFFYASRVADLLVEKFNFSRDRLQVESMGETSPAVSTGSYQSQTSSRHRGPCLSKSKSYR
jgi:hypothetical protein